MVHYPITLSITNNNKISIDHQFDSFSSLQAPGPKSSKQQQPSISITPLPRQPTTALSSFQLQAAASQLAKPSATGGIKPGQSSASGGKASFVICEICDGYIKDLDQLRNHMQWMHKVKVS